MGDQVRFEWIMERARVLNDRLQLYSLLSPPFFDGWDDVGSSSFSELMANQPFEEVTSHSSDAMEEIG